MLVVMPGFCFYWPDWNRRLVKQRYFLDMRHSPNHHCSTLSVLPQKSQIFLVEWVFYLLPSTNHHESWPSLATCDHSHLPTSVPLNESQTYPCFHFFFHFSMIKIFSMICMFCIKVKENNITIKTKTQC